MFLKVEYDLLRCENYHSAEKLLLAYFHSLEQSGRAFWGSPTYLASLMGTSTSKMEKMLKNMEQKQLIFRSGEGYKLNLTWSETLRIGTIDNNTDI